MNSTSQLHPLSMPDMFNTVFRLYRRHFLTFIGIVAWLFVPMSILRLFLELALNFRMSSIFDLLHIVVVQNVASAALAHAISRTYLSQPVTISTAYNYRRHTYGTAFHRRLQPIPEPALGNEFLATATDRPDVSLAHGAATAADIGTFPVGHTGDCAGSECYSRGNQAQLESDQRLVLAYRNNQSPHYRAGLSHL